MVKNKTIGILNSKLKDSSSKIIFENNELCCQFLRGYVDLPIFKGLKPEDIKDISTEFVPLFAESREADRVKEIKIAGCDSNAPVSAGKTFFLLSLIEHKTEVEYNIHMQIFRYMVYIWERYEREAEKLKRGSTRLKGFYYPPIIPVVYYENKKKWTAPIEFKERILLGKEFVKYIPNFSYYLVPVCKYSDESLIEQGDEISLIMLINKMQTSEDIQTFRKLPKERIEAIIQNSPEYLLDIIAKVLQAFLLKENVPVEETEELIGKVKERKMGQLFEGMEKMDIQEERRKTAEAMKQKAEMFEQGIKNYVNLCQELGGTKELAEGKLKEEFKLTHEEAEIKVKQYWK